MIRKIFVFWLVVSFFAAQPAPLLADSSELSEITEQLGDTTKRLQNQESGDAYRKFKCPSCGREFEMRVDLNDVEFKKGIKKVVCPYDGVAFYPKAAVTEEEKFQYETVRCPSCGREFKAYINVSAILDGRSQVLTCPYDNKKFYFKVESFKSPQLKWANLHTVICPTDKRSFKAYIDPNNPKELICPYDGTKFLPTPELIADRLGTQAQEAPAGGYFFNKGEAAEFTQMGAQAVSDMKPAQFPEERPSRIEEMFSENIPSNISKEIKQFGYDIFKPIGKETAEEGKKGDVESGFNKQGKSLLKDLLGAGQQGDMLKEGAGLEWGASSFLSPVSVPVISDYILGPGDTLIITVWGQIQDVFPATIDSEGKILLPKVGPLYLWGVKFSDAENMIRDNMLKVYTNIQVSVSLGQLRSIKVFVLGEARKAGAYNISALSNAFHAIYAAGGPSKTGSMRKARLSRKGSPDMPIDLYNVLLKGDSSQDYKLQSNDTIFIPPIGDVVGVAGNVKRPAVYELNERTKLSDVLAMAGGISAVGYLQRIQIERIQEHLRKIVLDLEFKSMADLKNSQNNLELQDGDLVLVFPIVPIRHNFVSIAGNVLREGDYELKEGMRLKDLVDKSGGFLPGTYLNRAEISRFKGDQSREIIAVNLAELMDGREDANPALKEWDIVTVYAKKDVLPDLFVEIDGAVNKPGKFLLTENMRISDLIFRGGGLKPNALLSNAELFRTSSAPDSKLISIDLSKVLSENKEEASNNDLVLEGGDNIFVREDVAREEKIVIALSGEFKYPGKYAVEKGTRLSEVIKRAGGFNKSAFLDGCVYARESVKNAQQRVLKNFLETEQKALLQEESQMAVGMTDVQAKAREQLVRYRQEMMAKLETVEMPGRILIRLNSNLPKFESSEYDLTVEDGDTLLVPTAPSTVQVVGNVYGQGVVAFSEGKGIDYYINKTGGLTKYADAGRMFVIRANGETISSFVRAVKIKRGDIIVVPEEFKYKTMPGLVIKDLIQVLYQAALGAAVTLSAINTM